MSKKMPTYERLALALVMEESAALERKSHDLAILRYEPGARRINWVGFVCLSVEHGRGIIAHAISTPEEIAAVRAVCKLCGMLPYDKEALHSGGEEVIVPWLTLLAARARLREEAA